MGKRQRWEQLDKSSTELPKLRKAFEVYCQVTGKSPNTIDWYDQRLESILPLQRMKTEGAAERLSFLFEADIGSRNRHLPPIITCWFSPEGIRGRRWPSHGDAPSQESALDL